MKNEAEARACYPQRWKVHPSMKIMRFRWGCSKWLQEFHPAPVWKQATWCCYLDNYAIHLTAQKKSQVYMYELLRVESFQCFSIPTKPWRGCTAGASLGVHCLLRQQLSAVDHVILKFKTVESKFKVCSIPFASAHWLRVGDWLWDIEIARWAWNATVTLVVWHLGCSVN